MNMLRWAYEEIKNTQSKAEPEVSIKSSESAILTIYDEEIRNIWRVEQEMVFAYKNILNQQAHRLNLDPEGFDYPEDLALYIITDIQDRVSENRKSGFADIDVVCKIIDLEIKINTLHELFRQCIEQEILKKDPLFIPGTALIAIRKGWRVTKSPVRKKVRIETIHPTEITMFAGLN